MRVGSLFSGIGGLDLGLERAGMTVAWQAETDPYASRVLARHWPAVPNHGDVRHIDWASVEPVEVLAAGYPCQPFSLAGARLGEDDPRHVWPAAAHAVGVLRPRWVVLENVPGHLSLGFGRVLGDLAALGYDAEWTCLSAAAAGAPHLRVRLFVVAYPERHGLRDEPAGLSRRLGEALARDHGAGGSLADAEVHGQRPGLRPGGPGALRDRRPGDGGGEGGGLADPDVAGLPLRGGPAGPGGLTVAAGSGLPGPDALGEQPGQRGREQQPPDGDGLRDLRQWAVEPDVGRVAHGVPSRVDRLRVLGNAVVPQCAELIGRAVIAMEEEP